MSRSIEPPPAFASAPMGDRAPDVRVKRWWTLLRSVPTHRTYSEYLWAYVFLVPISLAFIVFILYPLARGVMISMQASTAFSTDTPFVGLDNYARALNDPDFWGAWLVSLVFTVMVVPVHIVISLALAAILATYSSRVQQAYRAAFYIPQVTSGAVIGLIWLWILYPFGTGLANQLVTALGFPHQVWLGQTSTALPAGALIALFSGWGTGVVLYGAALAGIPRSLYEAADIDCAGPWSRFINVTVPLVKPTTLFIVVTSTIGSLQVFELFYVLTQGGPEKSTYTIVYMIYQIAFIQFDFGQGAAIAVILTAVLCALAVIQFKFLSTDVEY